MGTSLKKTMSSLLRGRWRTQKPRYLRRIKSYKKLVGFAFIVGFLPPLNIRTENQASSVQVGQGNNATLMNGASAVLAPTGGPRQIQQGVNQFLEGSAIFMKALDEVAKLHPFIGGATGNPNFLPTQALTLSYA
jgi:hypothetical protein